MFQSDPVGFRCKRFKILTVASFLIATEFVHADVGINFAFGSLRQHTGLLAPAGSLWALVVAPLNEDLPGNLKQDSSLTIEDISVARASFAGKIIAPGMRLGNALIIKTGQLSNEGILDEFINLSNVDYVNIQEGSLIGLYWFPSVNAEATQLPGGNFVIGGMQETLPDSVSGGNGGMVVPSNNGQILNIFYADQETLEGTRLPPSRFTAIHVPPSGYQVWREATFTPLQIEAGDALPQADPDGDGLVNLVEYATGSDPLQPNPGPLGLTASGESLFLQFPRIADPEVRYQIEATEDLSLSVWPDLIFESTGSDNLEEQIQLRQPLSPGQRFFRLRVEQ